MEGKGSSGWFTNRIINLITAHKEDVPKGFQLLEENSPESRSEALEFLVKIFEEEGKVIQAEHKKPYVTDDYENGVRRFAADLMSFLISCHEWIKANKNYKALCRNRHVAWGYYHTVNAAGYDGPVISEPEYQKILYLGLAEFYRGFYGNFYDNEEAIELLCKFYPEDSERELEEYASEIAAALYCHVSNAGTPNDTGYAYQGIHLITRYIGNLPDYMVEALIQEYPLYDILNNKISRHQIFTVIEYSGFEKSRKLKSKFWYLDSLMIMNLISSFLLKQIEMEEEGKEFENLFYDYIYRLSDKEFVACREPSVLWSNDFKGDRILYVDGKPLMGISLSDGLINVYHLERIRPVLLPYQYTDWMLEMYFDVQTIEEIQNFVLGNENRGKEFHGSMVFSLVWLDHYRGLRNQVIDFDHRFSFDRKSAISERKSEHGIPHIYGKSVYSLSCMVGKNATGKTSVMDFLRETFFKLLKLIEEGKLSCEEGCVKEEEYKDYQLLDEGARFLAVFSLDEKPYFLTNLPEIKGEGATPFRRGIYGSIRELSKAAYFSGQLRGDQRELLQDSPEEAVYDEEKREKRRVSKINDGFRQVDYSETGSFIRKRKAMELVQDGWSITAGFNRELCYQISFLKKCGRKKLCEYLDMTEEKEFCLLSRLQGEKRKKFRLDELQKETDITEELKEFMQLPDATMGYFSAGQYAKLSFLSRLHWFLEGDLEEMDRYNGMAAEAAFSREEVLLEGEAALIFIDEGEIYYHPEWQRGYLKELLELVNSRERKVQIVVTTNSPFLISDIRNEDITYLSGSAGDTGSRSREETMGQNIHKLLKDNFFMSYTIGEYARELIENIMDCLQQKVNPKHVLENYFDETEDEYELLDLLTEQIGEPVYRYQLKKMLAESDYGKQRSTGEKIRELEKQKGKLQEQIDRLKGME